MSIPRPVLGVLYIVTIFILSLLYLIFGQTRYYFLEIRFSTPIWSLILNKYLSLSSLFSTMSSKLSIIATSGRRLKRFRARRLPNISTLLTSSSSHENLSASSPKSRSVYSSSLSSRASVCLSAVYTQDSHYN
jgi:hypothetical protein